jgi:hypothetical protein
MPSPELTINPKSGMFLIKSPATSDKLPLSAQKNKQPSKGAQWFEM